MSEKNSSSPSEEQAIGSDSEKHICTRDLSEPDRRKVLKAMAGGGAVVLAGCLGDDEEPDEDDDPADEDDDEPDETLHVVEYVEQGETIDVPEDQNLLEAGEDAGMELPYQCRVGVCGECLSQVDGDAHDLVEMTDNDYEPLDADAISDGYVLTCTAQPRDDFALETGKAGELD